MEDGDVDKALRRIGEVEQLAQGLSHATDESTRLQVAVEAPWNWSVAAIMRVSP